jgi:hypothetical protein
MSAYETDVQAPSFRVLGLAFLFFSAIAPRAARAEPVSDSVMKDLAHRFASELDCASGKDLNRHWCPVAKIDQSGAFQAPPARRTFLGLSMALRKGGPVVRAALDTTDLAVLTIGPDGVLVTSLKPSNDAEKKSLGPVVLSLGMVSKGRATTVDVSPDLRDYLGTFARKPLHAIKPLAAGASYDAAAPSRIFHVTGTLSGEAYVVIEGFGNDAIVSLFPVAPYAAK